MRLIDADAFHESIFQRYCKNCNSQAHRMCHACWVMDMVDELEEAPNINPEDLRPKGRWIYLGESFFDTVYKCSECGHPEKMSKKCKKKYCHNCGSKMEE